MKYGVSCCARQNTKVAKKCLQQTNKHRTEILIHLRASIAFRSKSFYLFNIFSRHQDHQSKSAKMEKCCRRKTHSIKPLTPKISLVILLTVFHTVLVMLVWRIYCWINLYSPNWYCSLFSSFVYLILYLYCMEKFCLGKEKAPKRVRTGRIFKFLCLLYSLGAMNE